MRCNQVEICDCALNRGSDTNAARNASCTASAASSSVPQHPPGDGQHPFAVLFVQCFASDAIAWSRSLAAMLHFALRVSCSTPFDSDLSTAAAGCLSHV